MSSTATQPPGHRASATLAHRVVRAAEALTDKLLGRLRPTPSHVTVEAYLGHGSSHGATARGRAVAGRPIRPAAGVERAWRRLRRMIARFSTHDLDGVALELRCGDRVTRVTTDDEGYYLARWGPRPEPSAAMAPLEVIAISGLPAHADVHVDGDPAVVFVADATPHLIVSDIDDTILATGVGRRIRMVARTLTSSAWSRHQVDGMPRLLRELRDGPEGSGPNACFYVSSSPWNLYGFLRAFLRRHGCPDGPLFLSDYGVSEDVFIRSDHRAHKLSAIGEICSTNPDPALVLVGDTTEADPEIYATVAALNPGRVTAVLLHDDGDDPDARHTAEALLRDVAVPTFVGDGATLRRGARLLGLV